jgi:probable F420-dependent oxidoreductase
MSTPRRRYWGTIVPVPGPLLAQLAQQAEHLGLEGLWAPQLYGAPFLPLAAAAAVTQRVKLGTGVALAFTRSPLETALAAIDLDTISGGRAVLGIGTSLRWWNEDWHGAHYGKPQPHLREVVRLVRHIIANAHTGELGRWEGEYYRLDFRWFKNAIPPVRTAIPIYLPAVYENAIRMAGEIADGLVGHPIWSERWIANEVVTQLKRGLESAGRARSDFDLNIWAWVAIDADRTRAIEVMRGTVAFYASFAQYERFFAAHGFEQEARAICAAAGRNDTASMLRATPDAMVETFAIVGTTNDVRARVEQLWQVADSLTLAAPFYYIDPSITMAQQALIAETFYA